MLNSQMRRLMAVLITALVVAALTLPIPAAAQEAEDASAGGVQGVTALLLMLGLGAVILVGLYYVAENQAAKRRDPEQREE
jgi:hypothetical protein